MTSPKQPYVNLLFSAAAKINHAQLGQLKEDDRSAMYNHLLDMVSAGAEVDLGEATNLVVTEVVKAATKITPMLTETMTHFVDAQLGETYLPAGVATLSLLEDLELSQDWVVFVDPSGDAFAATGDEYQKILNEVGTGGLGELSGKLDALPGFLRDIIASVSARAAEKIFRIVGYAYSNDSGPRSLDQAMWEQEQLEEERVDKRRRQREVREIIDGLGEFCVCGECEACLARAAQVSPFELAEALEILDVVCDDVCPVNIMVAQQMVIATKAAAVAVAAEEIAEEIIEVAEEVAAEVATSDAAEEEAAEADIEASDTPAEEEAPEIESEAAAEAEAEEEAAAELGEGTEALAQATAVEGEQPETSETADDGGS